MGERHGGNPSLRTANVSASRRAVSESGNSDQGIEWRESRNGVPETASYSPGRRQAKDERRDDEIAAQVAAIRAQAVRRARERLGPGPLERRGAGWWEPVGEEGATA